jgi:hypothetical protein
MPTFRTVRSWGTEPIKLPRKLAFVLGGAICEPMRVDTCGG